MNKNSLHTHFLESHYGSISLEIVRQESRKRMVHLRDAAGISRTLGVVHFHKIPDGPLRKTHDRILAGSPLGETLLASGIDFEKKVRSRFALAMPDWLRHDFGSVGHEATGVFTDVYLRETEGGSGYLYAQVLEVIPPEVASLMPPSDLVVARPGRDEDALLEYASIRPESKNQNMHSCIVIGAGPGGIVATKELLEKGFEDTLCLEQASKIGGVFAKCYDNLTLTSSVTFSMFSDFWVGDGKSHSFWSKDEAVQYWSDYADHFGVTGHIRFNTRVAEVSQNPDGNWEINLEGGETLLCRHLVMAIGNNNIPKYPEWKEQLTEIPYSHSRDYKNAEPFRGQKVLIVGGGESGSDVAYEISQVAEKCWVSLRATTGWIVPRKRGEHAADVSTHRGIWDLPREYGRKLSPYVLKLERARQDPVFDVLADLNEKVRSKNGIWGIFGTKTLALPKAVAHHGAQVVGGITEVCDGGRTLKTADGFTLEEVDTVVFSTGYLNRAEFMPEELRSCDPRKMYKHVFHPDLGDKLAWIGWARPGFGSQFPIMEMQARYCALIFSGEMKLPDRGEMIETAQKDEEMYLEQFEDNARQIRSLVDYHRYMNGMAKLIGCFPPLTTYFFTNPKMWLHLMYGPTQATQFRLRGPGKKVELAHDIMRKLPLSTYNHIVKAGLRGRLYYGLRSLNPFASGAKA